MRFLYRIWTHSIRRQLIFSIAAIHAVLMGVFVYDMVLRQKEFLYEQNIEHTRGLSETLALNSVSWILARDYVGMEELIQSQVMPSMKYAMLLSPECKVLAHSENEHVGQYLQDSVSLQLLTATRQQLILVNDSSIIDIASPVVFDGKLIGWARVGLSQRELNESLRQLKIDGIQYTLIAIVIGSVIAALLGRQISSGLMHLVHVAKRIKHGDENARYTLARYDEVGQLGDSINSMVDSLLEQKSIIQQTTEELLQAKHKAEESDKLKSAFLENISHEIRTPLNAILGFSKLMGRPGVRENRLGELSDMVQENGKKLLDIVTDIITISMLEQKQEQVYNYSFDLYGLLKNVYDEYRSQATAKKIDFKLRVEPQGKLMVCSDERKIERILNYLLSNAMKFTEQGIIEFGYTLKSDSVLFFVKDTGIGIPVESHAVVFDSFRKVDSSTTSIYGGNGLGLSIAKGFVQLMHGTIWFESSPNIGSVFYFSLPLIRTDLNDLAYGNN